ncbi:MAG: hypothetical protein WCK21_03035 [Actinomycetota bacterium]
MAESVTSLVSATIGTSILDNVRDDIVTNIHFMVLMNIRRNVLVNIHFMVLVIIQLHRYCPW